MVEADAAQALVAAEAVGMGATVLTDLLAEPGHCWPELNSFE